MTYQLPLAWNWTSGQTGGTSLDYPTPTWQREQIEAGRPLMPHVELWPNREWKEIKDYSTPAFETAAERGLPLGFVGDNVLTWFDRFDEFTDNADPNQWQDHAWFVKDNGEGEEPSTSFKNLSVYSERSPEWGYRLGYIIGTSPQIVEAAKIYPVPPCVFFFDNNEAVFTQLKSDYRDIRERLDDNFGEVRSFREYIKPIINSASFDFKVLAQKERDALDRSIHAAFVRQVWLKFNQGFEAGLRTHNQHWAKVAGFCAYRHMSGPDGQELNLMTNKGEPTWKRRSFGFNTQGHRFGVTGELYLQPWFGEWDNEGPWTDISDQAFKREAEDMLLGTNAPLRTMLTWEGKYRNPSQPALNRPPREEWQAYVRCALWMTRSELAGHFAGSSMRTDSAAIDTYHDVVIRACEEVRDNRKLTGFWLWGRLLRSISGHPGLRQHWMAPTVGGTDYYFQYVNEEFRYEENFRSHPCLEAGQPEVEARNYLATARRNVDWFRRDLGGKANFDYACFGIEWDQLVLFFISQVYGNRKGPVTAKVGIDGVIRDIEFPEAITGGRFYVYNKDDETLEVVA